MPSKTPGIQVPRTPIWPFLLFAYVVVGLLTFGNYANHRCGSFCGLDALAAGYLWPVYWAGRVALEVTK